MIQPSRGSRRPSGWVLLAIVLIAVLGIVVVISSLTVLQLPEAVTEQGKKTKDLYTATLTISMIIYFGVSAGIIWAIFRYRRTGPELPPQTHGNSTVEFICMVIPIVILVGLFIPSLILLIDLKTPPDDSKLVSGEVMTVEVIGAQWYWQFVYCPTGKVYDASALLDCESGNNLRVSGAGTSQPPVLVLPVGQTVVLKIKSNDVVHSFYAPHLLYKMQAIPGNINEMHFKIEKAGTYTGQCYQFCGLSHADMRFAIDAKDPAEYQQWLNQQKKAQGLPAGPDNLAAADSGN